jgi:sporulation protein YlmC with PRC-barrel domain
MLKKLALSASILLLGTSLALAQGMAKEPSRGSATATSPSPVLGQKLPASDIYKANVYDPSDNKIGDIRDLVINETDGTITSAVIGVGGFLGIREKGVAVPFKDLKMSSREGKIRLVLDRTKEQLKSAATYTSKVQRREETSGRSAAVSSSSLSTPEWLISDVYKADVYDNSGHKIGKITDLMMDSNGDITKVAINVGDFLGAGKKEVAIPFKDLKVASRDGKDWLTLNETKNDLMKAPAFEKSTAKKM